MPEHKPTLIRSRSFKTEKCKPNLSTCKSSQCPVSESQSPALHATSNGLNFSRNRTGQRPSQLNFNQIKSENLDVNAFGIRSCPQSPLTRASSFPVKALKADNGSSKGLIAGLRSTVGRWFNSFRSRRQPTSPSTSEPLVDNVITAGVFKQHPISSSINCNKTMIHMSAIDNVTTNTEVIPEKVGQSSQGTTEPASILKVSDSTSALPISPSNLETRNLSADENLCNETQTCKPRAAFCWWLNTNQLYDLETSLLCDQHRYYNNRTRHKSDRKEMSCVSALELLKMIYNLKALQPSPEQIGIDLLETHELTLLDGYNGNERINIQYSLNNNLLNSMNTTRQLIKTDSLASVKSLDQGGMARRIDNSTIPNKWSSSCPKLIDKQKGMLDLWLIFIVNDETSNSLRNRPKTDKQIPGRLKDSD